MIGTIDIKVNAAHPNMPLSPVYTFLGSPQQVRVINVPKQIGNWKITAVQITVNYPDNSSPSVEATLTGGCWHGTLPASTLPGKSLMGFKITASGVDEHGDPITGYVLGKGDAYVLDDDATITVGGTTYYVHIVDTTPETPHKGDLDLSTMKLWNGSAWVSLGGITSVSWSDITGRPTTFPPSAHTHAQSDVTGLPAALSGKLDLAGGEMTMPIYGGYKLKFIGGTGGASDGIVIVNSNGDPVVTFGVNSGELSVDCPNYYGKKFWGNKFVAGGHTILEADKITNGLRNYAFPSESGTFAILSDLEDYLADNTPNYSASSTYAVGAFVKYGGALYVCKTAITTAEAWTPAHWTAMPGVSALFSSANTSLMGVVRYAFNSNGTIKDRAINAITYAGGALPNFPAQVSGYARDFLLNVTATATASDITLPESGATSVGDALAFEASHTYLVAITEIAAKKYYIRIIDTTPANA